MLIAEVPCKFPFARVLQRETGSQLTASRTTRFKQAETVAGELRNHATKVADFCWSAAYSVSAYRAAETFACGG